MINIEEPKNNILMIFRNFLLKGREPETEETIKECAI